MKMFSCTFRFNVNIATSLLWLKQVDVMSNWHERLTYMFGSSDEIQFHALLSALAPFHYRQANHNHLAVHSSAILSGLLLCV